MKAHRTYSLIVVCAFGALSLVAARADDNVTNIVSGTTTDYAGDNYIVGSTGTNNYLRIDSGGTLVNVFDSTIGKAATANGNSALVTGTGSYWQSTDKLFIGSTGWSNSLAVSDGAVVSGGNRVFLGWDVASSYNRALVSGTGSVLQTYAFVSQNYFVGRFGGNNFLTISNGGAGLGTPDTGYLCELILGGGNAAASNNTALITGPGSVWNGNHTLQVGAGPGAGNRLIVTNGGSVTVADSVHIGFGTAPSNSVVVTGPGSVLQAGLDPESITLAVNVGYTATGNSLVISDGGTVSNTLGYIGTFASGNSALVTGAGSSWQNVSEFAVGYGGPPGGGNCSLIISNGGVVANGGDGYIGKHCGINQALVTGAGSAWQNNGVNFWMGWDPNLDGNSLTISNGGAVYAHRVVIGGLSGNNRVLITGPGSLLQGSAEVDVASGEVDVGLYSPNNTLAIANGGLVSGSFFLMNDTNCALSIGDGTTTATASGLYVNMIYADDRLNFNAGKLSATADAANLIFGAGSVYIQSGGAVIDSQTFTVGIPVGIQQDGASPGGGLNKIGSGILTLGGANTFTGLSTVNNGTLNLTGSLLSGADVKSDATLTGNGTISGPVTVEADATLQPGLGAVDTSTLTINNTLNLAGTALFALNRGNSQNSSRISGITSLTRGGVLTVVNVGDPPQAGDTFTLFDAASVGGAFTATNLPSLDSGLAWRLSSSSKVLTVVPSVNPTPTNMTCSLSGNTLTLTWPGSHLGWYAQSNSVNLADPASWFDIPGSQTVTILSIPVNSAPPRVFYRMRLP